LKATVLPDSRIEPSTNMDALAMRADRLIAVLSATLLLLSAACAVPVKLEHPAPLTPAEVTAYADQTLIKGAPSGEKQKMNDFIGLNPDCTATGVPKVTFVTPPAHGTMTVEQGEDYPNFPKDNARAVCNARKVPAVLLYYQSAPGYTGNDVAVVEVVFPAGNLRHQTYTITVR
jgi:hypothetical protein